MTDRIPTHPGPEPGPYVVATGDGATFLQRTPEVREEYATEALDEMFDWYEDYVAHRAAIDHYLEALTVVQRWATDPTAAPGPLPEPTAEGDEEAAPAGPDLTRPFRPMRPARPLLMGRERAFGAAVADTEQLRADLRREVADVVPKALAHELEARLPILLNEQLRDIGAARAFTPVGGRYTPDTSAQPAPAIEEQLVTADAPPARAARGVDDGATAAAPARTASHPPAPRRNRR